MLDIFAMFTFSLDSVLVDPQSLLKDPSVKNDVVFNDVWDYVFV